MNSLKNKTQSLDINSSIQSGESNPLHDMSNLERELNGWPQRTNKIQKFTKPGQWCPIYIGISTKTSAQKFAIR